jgi:hypothetical protein
MYLQKGDTGLKSLTTWVLMIECPVSTRHPSKRGELKIPPLKIPPPNSPFINFLFYFPLYKFPPPIPPFLKGARGI